MTWRRILRTAVAIAGASYSSCLLWKLCRAARPLPANQNGGYPVYDNAGEFATRLYPAGPCILTLPGGNVHPNRTWLRSHELGGFNHQQRLLVPNDHDLEFLARPYDCIAKKLQDVQAVQASTAVASGTYADERKRLESLGLLETSWPAALSYAQETPVSFRVDTDRVTAIIYDKYGVYDHLEDLKESFFVPSWMSYKPRVLGRSLYALAKISGLRSHISWVKVYDNLIMINDWNTPSSWYKYMHPSWLDIETNTISKAQPVYVLGEFDWPRKLISDRNVFNMSAVSHSLADLQRLRSGCSTAELEQTYRFHKQIRTEHQCWLLFKAVVSLGVSALCLLR